MRCIPSSARSVSSILLLFAVASPGAVAAQERNAGPVMEDVLRVSALGSVELSPGGEYVLYTRRVAELEENESRTHIWRVPADRGEAVQMTRGPRSDTRPRWRPDGRGFAFLSARPGAEERGAASGPAIHLMPAFGGEAERLYAHPTGVGAFEWSPDGSRIAFTALDEETEEEKDRKKQGRDVTVEGEAGRYTHLWVLDVESREARRLTSGRDFTVQAFEWSPDGRRLAFRGTPSPLITESWDGRIYVVEAGDTAPVPRRVSPTGLPAGAPSWTPDGGHLVYAGSLEAGYRIGYNRMLRIPADGGEPEDVSPRLDVSVSDYTFTEDGLGVFFNALTGTTMALFYMPLDTREPVRLTPDSGLWGGPFGGASFSRDRRRVAFVHESPDAPAEVYVAALRAGPSELALADAAAVTDHNAHARDWAVGRTEVVRWASTDGWEVEGLVIHPAGWTPEDGPRALVTVIHGGPAAAFVQSFQASSSRANAQVYAADGYAVFLPNPRGSTGYGEETVRAVIEDWGGMDYEDIVTGVDALIERGLAHPDSLGVMGWSYGGYMTARIVTRTDRFRAAVVGAGITETISMWGTHDILHVWEAYYGGSPYDPGRWEVYQRASPLATIRQAATPTLFIHGVDDARTPPNQAQIMYRALRANGVETELVWLPRTGHGPSEPGLQLETAARQKEWMDRWIRGAGRPLAADAEL